MYLLGASKSFQEIGDVPLGIVLADKYNILWLSNMEFEVCYQFTLGNSNQL